MPPQLWPSSALPCSGPAHPVPPGTSLPWGRGPEPSLAAPAQGSVLSLAMCAAAAVGRWGAVWTQAPLCPACLGCLVGAQLLPDPYPKRRREVLGVLAGSALQLPCLASHHCVLPAAPQVGWCTWPWQELFLAPLAAAPPISLPCQVCLQLLPAEGKPGGWGLEGPCCPHWGRPRGSGMKHKCLTNGDFSPVPHRMVLCPARPPRGTRTSNEATGATRSSLY